MKSMKNSAGFTLIELVVSVTMSAVVIFAILSIIVFTTTTLQASVIEQSLQIDMNNLTRQVTDGVFDSGDINGLRGAVSYNIPITSPVGRQVNFTDTLGVARSFSFSASDNSLSYSGTVIYTAPVGSTLNVVFSSAAWNRVNLRMSVTQTVNGKFLTGSEVTSVYLRNA